ncbi:MAG: hypothetical protein ABIZ49_09280 [Opitutaceae bacterium]
MIVLLLFAPAFLIFEVWQLVLAERYLGVKQIARGSDPRALGLGEVAAFFWSSAILVYWLWMLALLALPAGRLYALGLLALTGIGFVLRRGAPLKWVLVILTFEGALRNVLLLVLCAVLWRQLR